MMLLRSLLLLSLLLVVVLLATGVQEEDSSASDSSSSSSSMNDEDEDSSSSSSSGTSSSSASKLLRVFILAGQSNMEGKGSIEHLKSLLLDDDQRPKYAKYWDILNMNFATRDDVFVRFLDYSYGNLTIDHEYAIPKDRFGPEVGFGWTVAEELDDAPILLIKTAYGGKALTVEFRPPTSPLSGVLQYPCYFWETCDPFRPSDYGNTYRDMIWNIYDTLDNLDKYVPGYDEDEFEVELSGLVWFQGWNDVIDPNRVAEYEPNLIELIKSIRLDLDTPDLPFLIAELGQHGDDLSQLEKYDRQRVTTIRHAQQNVCQNTFANTCRFVRTAPFLHKEEPSFDGFYHYYGRADTFIDIGEAMGEAMLDLLGELEDEEDSGR